MKPINYLLVVTLLYAICAASCSKFENYNTLDDDDDAPLDTSVVHTYPAPSGIELSDQYTVEVNGNPVDLYIGSVGEHKNNPEFYGGDYAFGNFDFSGSVTVSITTAKTLANLKIQPLSLGITPVVSGNTITFTLEKPAKISIEPDGKNEPLLLFANALEVDPPQPGDPNVVYFGPGIHNPPGNVLNINSNQTLYLAGGAVLRAGITIQGSNIRVAGRGLLDCNPWGHTAGPSGRYPLFVKSSADVEIEGITIWGAWGWSIPIGMSESVTVSNVKICGARVWNDDGIDICSSSDVTISDCFIRSDDDCIAIKGFTWGGANRDVSDITIKDCTLWCDRARAILIGHESRAAFMENITLENIDIIHYGFSPIVVEPINEMTIRNVEFDDIRLNGEGQTNEFIRVRTTANIYANNTVNGHVNSISFNAVNLTNNGGAKITVHGSAGHVIDDVVFNDVMRNGTFLNISSSGVSVNGYVTNISFTP